jgi:hypothetical protein
LYIARPDHPGWLWALSPGEDRLGTPVQVASFADQPACGEHLPVVKELVAAGGNVFLYEPFGGKSDRTGVCPEKVPGGAWLLDPATGQLVRQIASGFHFNRLVANRLGSELYGIDAGDGWGRPLLVSIDSRDGSVIRTRRLDAGYWAITTAVLRIALQGDQQVNLAHWPAILFREGRAWGR